MVQIVPTLFSTTEEEYKKRLDRLLNSSFTKDGWVQLDLMDNKFAPNLSIGLDVIKKYQPPFNMEAQLMVVDPYAWVDGLISLGVKRIIAPLELHYKEVDRFFDVCQDLDVEVGLSLNPDTDVESLDPYLKSLDAVLLMAVNPGMENQKFDTRTYQKIKYIKQRIPKVKVGVDGGVTDNNIKELVEAGVDYLAIGSYLFNGDFDENLERLWEALRPIRQAQGRHAQGKQNG